jgi:molybdopterin-guanine dinucleotide biosynthesis protein A
VGRALVTVANPVVEVGPGVTEFVSTREVSLGDGPLAAIAAGWEYLLASGNPRPALVLAADLPLISPGLLRLLAEWPGDGSVVPVVDGVA